MNRLIWIFVALAVPCTACVVQDAYGQTSACDAGLAVLPPGEWSRIDQSVDRALAWLAAQQQRDGSFPTLEYGQPGVTGLCVLAFLAHGHVPGEGPYGQRLDAAISFILACQKESGLVALVAPPGATITRNVSVTEGNTATYNHAIASLALCEAYAAGGGVDAQRMQQAIKQALAASLQMQSWPKRRRVDIGGWRYLHVHSSDEEPFDSDLSATGWHLMFLRSAKNSGFSVPQQPIDDAVAYIRRCFSSRYGAFQLMATNYDRRSRGMAGAGILALAHAGYHNAQGAQLAGDWILAHDFRNYNQVLSFDGRQSDDRYHYSVFNCCQGMYQLGGDYWKKFFPPTARVLLENQSPDGSWQPESRGSDTRFGNAYTTALVVMTLGAPNQLLPIFQR